MEQLVLNLSSDTIVAVSTPPGTGGIAVIRVSGPEAFSIVDKAWKGKSLSSCTTHTVHLGKYQATDGNVLDEAVAAVFRKPSSFTGEDVVELSIHGSKWIQREMLSDLVKRGARVASPGEFTQRAFLNGRLDLAQAEGVADLIASSSRAAHRLAITQTRGGFSKQLESLRQKLIDFASYLELELDFSEEDVEFADRTNLLALAYEIKNIIRRLVSSYSSGAVIKEGVPVVIAGIPNAGKSSLLNLILGDDKAIVSDIPGTTRDTIEDTIEINGILYRFIDTAGLRPTSDTIENLGIDRAKAKMRDAKIIIWIIDPTSSLQPQLSELTNYLGIKNPHSNHNIENINSEMPELISKNGNNLASIKEDICNDKSLGDSEKCEDMVSKIKSLIILINKSDILSQDQLNQTKTMISGVFASEFQNRFSEKGNDNIGENVPCIPFSTKTGSGEEALYNELNKRTLEEIDIENDIVITNARHYEALTRAQQSLDRAIKGIETGISADFIAQDIRETLHHLGTITGAITTPLLLQTIFSRFCIGK